ncbi:MAG TPA: adenosylhomocysteinase [Conexivisphaerales archaeon]|nr:adenosylhomocysteinase [Conexivisphaerales archaeon]
MKDSVKDLSLAPSGAKKMKWARARMPVIATLASRLAKERPLEGVKVGACLHLEAKTAVLCATMQELGAEVAVTGSNPLTTQDDVAAALARDVSHVYAWRGETPEEYERNLGLVLDTQPSVLVDDGADLSVMAMGRGMAERITGVTEETTTGVRRFRNMEREGKLPFPVVAVNDAYSKHLFDNRFGSGQSVVDGLMRSTNMILAGRRCVVAGFGWVGRGVAERLRGMGARTVVCEVDPFKALEAHFEGFEVLPMDDAVRTADVIVSCTGGEDIVGRRHFAKMKDGAILANAGHFDVEVNVKELREVAVNREEVRPNVTQFTLKGGKKLYLLADGRLVNIAAADGHPIEIMDMSFSLQLMSVVHLVRNGDRLENRVISVPRELDEEVARLRLKADGVAFDSLSRRQRAYLGRWGR